MIGLFSGKKLKIIIRTEKQYHFYRTGSAGRLLFILTWEDGLQGSRKHTVPVLAPWGGGVTGICLHLWVLTSCWEKDAQDWENDLQPRNPAKTLPVTVYW